MFIQRITEVVEDAISRLRADKEKYVTQKDAFSRKRKFTFRDLILFCMTKGAKSTGNEIEEYYRWDPECPSESGVLQQRSKLKAEALAALLRDVGMSLLKLFGPPEKFLLVAADGSGCPFLNPRGNENDAWRDIPKRGRPFGHAHVTMLYDALSGFFLDAFIQPVHAKNERAAFIAMIDRFVAPWKHIPVIFTADKGFPSWNIAAHVIQSGHYFLIRTKDVVVSGSQLHQLIPVVPTAGCFDMWVNVRIVRRRRGCGYDPKTNTMTVYVAGPFDYAEAKTDQSFKMRIRVSRFRLPDGSWECVMTNLPKSFPTAKLAKLYWLRWGIESALGRCKSPLALESVSSRKPELVMQDIFGTIIAYNVVSAFVHAAEEELAEELAASPGTRKHERAVSFSNLVGPCRELLLRPEEWSEEQIIACCRRHMYARRPNRPAPPRGRIRKRGAVPFVGRAA